MGSLESPNSQNKQRGKAEQNNPSVKGIIEKNRTLEKNLYFDHLILNNA